MKTPACSSEWGSARRSIPFIFPNVIHWYLKETTCNGEMTPELVEKEIPTDAESCIDLMELVQIRVGENELKDCQPVGKSRMSTKGRREVLCLRSTIS